MSLARSDERHAAPPGSGILFGLLDLVFGFFVWAAHFLTVYVAAAVACQLGLEAAGPATRTIFVAALVLVTLATAALLALHAFRRYRQYGRAGEKRFRASVTVGSDAIAAVAVVAQLLPLLMVPLCA